MFLAAKQLLTSQVISLSFELDIVNYHFVYFVNGLFSALHRGAVALWLWLYVFVCVLLSPSMLHSRL